MSDNATNALNYIAIVCAHSQGLFVGLWLVSKFKFVSLWKAHFRGEELSDEQMVETICGVY
jgi:hypothetical protein